MSLRIEDENNKLYLDMLVELYELHSKPENIVVIAFFRMIDKVKVYYDFQLLDQPKLNGSYDKLNINELIFYLENE